MVLKLFYIYPEVNSIIYFSVIVYRKFITENT